MAMMILKYKVMPESPEIDLELLSKEVKKAIENYGGFVNEIGEAPVGFGLKAIEVSLSLDEKKGSEEIENLLKEIGGVSEIEIVSMSRALG